MGMYFGAKLFAVIRPITFAHGYNNRRGFSSLSLAPSLAASDGGAPSPGLVVRLEY